MNNYGKKLNGAAKGVYIIKLYNVSEKLFSDGIHQSKRYKEIESHLSVTEIKRYIRRLGCKIHDELLVVEEKLESPERIEIRDLEELFSILDSKERKMERFEKFEEHALRDIEQIKTMNDLRNLRRLYKI